MDLFGLDSSIKSSSETRSQQSPFPMVWPSISLKCLLDTRAGTSLTPLANPSFKIYRTASLQGVLYMGGLLSFVAIVTASLRSSNEKGGKGGGRKDLENRPLRCGIGKVLAMLLLLANKGINQSTAEPNGIASMPFQDRGRDQCHTLNANKLTNF